MDLYGFIWIYMDLYGFIWIYMDLLGESMGDLHTNSIWPWIVRGNKLGQTMGFWDIKNGGCEVKEVVFFCPHMIKSTMKKKVLFTNHDLKVMTPKTNMNG